MKRSFSLTNALSAGIAGTVVLTLFTYMGRLMNIQMDIPRMLSSMFGNIIALGWVMHFMIGIILAASYGYVFYSVFSFDQPWLRGMLYGIIPWLMAQILVMPMMMTLKGMSYSSGLFSGSAKLAMASLVGHLIFGAVIGQIYRPQQLAVPVSN